MRDGMTDEWILLQRNKLTPALHMNCAGALGRSIEGLTQGIVVVVTFGSVEAAPQLHGRVVVGVCHPLDA